MRGVAKSDNPKWYNILLSDHDGHVGPDTVEESTAFQGDIRSANNERLLRAVVDSKQVVGRDAVFLGA